MIKSLLLLTAFLITDACVNDKPTANRKESVQSQTMADVDSRLQDKDVAYFASGCFWCVEEVFESLQGVDEVLSGYAGGSKQDATYEKVSSGSTKHAEAVKVYYDKTIITYEQLVKVFFGSHDPTTLNRQGPDRGYQYRSAIFYQNEEEKNIAELVIHQLTESKAFDGPITTTLDAYVEFYPAEEYHQDYVTRNPNNGYVRSVSLPRYEKFKTKFPDLLKKSAH